MARQKGANNFAGTLEPLAGGPLDARVIVPTKADLILSGNFPYPYVGLICAVQAEGKAYILTDIDYTDLNNWKELGAGSSGASALADLTDVNLTELADGKILIYDATNEEWVCGDNQSGQVIQYEELPLPSEEWEYKIIQYVGLWDPEFSMYPGYFYECVENEENPGEYEWKQIDTQPSGGSGSGSLQKAIVAAVDVGGIEVGDEFLVGTPYDDMWDALLNPTLYPTFTAPSASLSYSADTYYEVKSSIPAKTATESLNRGSISPAYGTSGYRSGAATNYAIATSGADTEYSDSSASSNTFSVPALTRSTKGNIVLTATVSYAAGEQPKDSKGNNYDSPLAAGSKTTSKTMQFIQAYFYGKSSTSTVSSFSGLSKSVTAKGEKKFNYTTNNEYMVIAYDSSYGNLKTILDPNSFDVTSGWTKSTLTVDGFTYNVYVANSPTTDTDAQFTFKY